MKPNIIIEAFSVRQATLADIPELMDLGVLAYGQYAETLGNEHWSQMQKNLRNGIMFADLINKATCFVTSYNGKIVGMAFLLPSGKTVDVYEADWCSIRLVAVHPLYRGKQLAKTLTQLCIKHAIDTGEHTIALHSSSMMPAAMHVYESFGFKMIRNIGERFGQQYFLYTLNLAPKTSAP